jgi:hypothetical protein
LISLVNDAAILSNPHQIYMSETSLYYSINIFL